jgi:hypothetical protein
MAGGGRTGAVAWDQRCRTARCRSQPSRAAWSDTRPVGGPEAQDHAHRCATRWTPGDAGWGGDDPRRLALERPCRHAHPAERVGRARPAGREQAKVADWHAAVREHGLAEPTATLQSIAGGGAGACPADLAGGAGARAVRAADKALVGEGHPADRRGAGGAGGVAVGRCLPVDMPGEGPGLRIARLSQTGWAHGFFAERPGEGGEGCDRDQAVGAGRAPCRAVLGEAPARDTRVQRGVRLQRSAPGLPDTREPREGGPEDALSGGQPLQGRGSRRQQGVRGEALRGAEQGTQGRGDGKGEEAVRPGPLSLQGVVEPLRGGMPRTLGTVAVPTGRVPTMGAPPRVARREAVAVAAAWALWDGAEDVAVCRRARGRALQGCWRKRRADLAEGGHDRSRPARVDALSG